MVRLLTGAAIELAGIALVCLSLYMITPWLLVLVGGIVLFLLAGRLGESGDDN